MGVFDHSAAVLAAVASCTHYMVYIESSVRRAVGFTQSTAVGAQSSLQGAIDCVRPTPPPPRMLLLLLLLLVFRSADLVGKHSLCVWELAHYRQTRVLIGE